MFSKLKLLLRQFRCKHKSIHFKDHPLTIKELKQGKTTKSWCTACDKYMGLHPKEKYQ